MNDALNVQLDLIRFDYERTLGFVDGVVRISMTLRQTTVAAVVALLGVALQQDSWEFAVAGAAVAVLLGLYDLYHGWLYTEALKRINTMEAILREAFRASGRLDDDHVANRLVQMVEAHQFGPITTTPKFRVRYLCTARPAGMYLLYPVALAGAALTGCVVC